MNKNFKKKTAYDYVQQTKKENFSFLNEKYAQQGQTVLSDEKGRLAKEYCYDGLHLNAQGFEIVSENTIPLLK